MEKTPDSPVAAGSTQALEDKIDKLGVSIDKLSQSVDHIKPPREEVKEENKTTSRTVVAAALGLLGFKIGALVGAKVGIVKMVTAKPELGAESGAFFEKFVRKTSVPALIGSGIGAAVGAVAGWFRGDRIKEPGDLIKKPIESIGRIFGPRPKDMDDHAPHTTASSEAQSGKWQKRMDERAATSEIAR